MIIEINKNSLKDIELLKLFISSMGNSVDSFRYYKSRPISVIENHLVTVILLVDNLPVGYGHLDKDGNNIWLGIAISQDYTGKGYGKMLMSYLVSKADVSGIKEVKLSVDKSNVKAIKLYNYFEFIQFQEKEEILYFSRKQSE